MLSLDDFGTGFSALNYLRDLPVHELKIDKAFVQGMMDVDSPDRIVVESTIALAHRLGMQVVAEGVEDPQTERALAALGCDFVQGYLHSPALPAAQIGGWLAERRQSRALPSKSASTFWV
jgi:EAL domain-containing protein (putative c-di-GMP-specific phosphodiesterase class I)